jgi:hypothetical protein
MDCLVFWVSLELGRDALSWTVAVQPRGARHVQADVEEMGNSSKTSDDCDHQIDDATALVSVVLSKLHSFCDTYKLSDNSIVMVDDGSVGDVTEAGDGV